MDKKNGFRNLSLSLLVKLGISQPGEELVADTTKAKVVFAVLQLVYTLITVLPTYFLYSSYRLSCVYLVLIFGWGTWNGASYYIEVFAERYRLQFVTESEVDDGEIPNGDLESDEEEYENAMEDVEIDQSSELYQTIVAAIMEDKNTETGIPSTLEGIKRTGEEGENEEDTRTRFYFSLPKPQSLNIFSFRTCSGAEGWEDVESELVNIN